MENIAKIWKPVSIIARKKKKKQHAETAFMTSRTPRMNEASRSRP